jgi:hypothetical protein
MGNCQEAGLEDINCKLLIYVYESSYYSRRQAPFTLLVTKKQPTIVIDLQEASTVLASTLYSCSTLLVILLILQQKHIPKQMNFFLWIVANLCTGRKRAEINSCSTNVT